MSAKLSSGQPTSEMISNKNKKVLKKIPKRSEKVVKERRKSRSQLLY